MHLLPQQIKQMDKAQCRAVRPRLMSAVWYLIWKKKKAAISLCIILIFNQTLHAIIKSLPYKLEDILPVILIRIACISNLQECHLKISATNYSACPAKYKTIPLDFHIFYSLVRKLQTMLLDSNIIITICLFL